MSTAPLNLTQHEILAMQAKHNLAAAHARQLAPSPIVDRLPQLWRDAEGLRQQRIEERFLHSFFELHKQPTAAATGRTLLSYSASVATMIVGTFLMQRGLSVTLIEPCVDNVADVLRHLKLSVQAIDETLLASPRNSIYQELVEAVNTDALFLIDPNNPTGFTLLHNGRSGFEEVVRYCVDHRKILVLDLCFAAFVLADEKLDRFDIYELLESSGVSYLAIEDTGKTWPVRDAKCAMLTVSEDLWDAVYDIHTSVLLNVSPFVLNLLTEHIRHSLSDKLSSLRDIIARNRDLALSTMDGSILCYQEPIANVSVAWFRIAHRSVTASALQQKLADVGVYVLPGTYFYWKNPSRGERFIRIALAREPAAFAAGIAQLRAALNQLAGTDGC